MSNVRARKRKRKSTRRRLVRFGAPDASLTGSAGVVVLAALIERLGVVRALDVGVGPIKVRERGLSGGQLLVALAQCQLLGGQYWVDLDRQRADTAAQRLSAVPAVPATTAATLARRFGPAQLAGLEAGNAVVLARAFALLPAGRREVLMGGPVTIDMDSTDVEVYGPGKQGVAYNYCGQRAGRPHLATWAEAGLTLAADLLAGNEDVRPRAADLLGRALGALPAQVRFAADPERRPVVRADAGYFTAELANAAVDAGCDFAIAAKRNTAMWRAAAAIPDSEWVPAIGMHDTEVAACDYAPAGWPPGSYTIVRRVKIAAEDISADPRARRRRTIDKAQLALALDGDASHAYATSFIVTNLPVGEQVGRSVTDVEAWFRRRTDIEDRIREAKLGAGLSHLPSGRREPNAIWMWAALLAGNLSSLLQALSSLDTDGRGRAHGPRLRHELLRVPARVIAHARSLTLRLPPGPQLLPQVLSRLRALPPPT